MSEASITTGGRERVPNAVKLYERAFAEDPVIIYFLCSLSEKRRLAYMESYMNTLMTAAALNDGIFEEINDWQSAAVWMPVGKRVDNTWTFLPAGFLKVLWMCGIKGCKRMLIEFQSQMNEAKKKHLAGRKYHYLFFIGTELEHRKKGLSSALIKHRQDLYLKSESPLPIWLESTTENSMRLYAKLGFKTVHTVVVGKGEAGPDGRRKKGGEGVKIWAMIWEPDKAVAKAELNGQGS